MNYDTGLCTKANFVSSVFNVLVHAKGITVNAIRLVVERVKVTNTIVLQDCREYNPVA